MARAAAAYLSCTATRALVKQADKACLSSFVASSAKGLYLANIPIMFLGLLACCVGIIPAGAFVMLMWPTAYLAMTGELSVEQPR